MNPENITSKIDDISFTINDTFKGKQIFVSSSFQTQSIPLLHIISRIDRNIPVYFINTGYHFPETLIFREHIANQLGLNIIDLQSTVPKSHQRNEKGNLLYTSDPDYCCHINKVQPLEPILMTHDIWISGVRADQNSNRKNFKSIQEGPFDVSRYHPMLNWSGEDIKSYIDSHDLPRHPLEGEGYTSMGCMPCTRKANSESLDEREGRWMGLTKTECGLHTEWTGK